MTTETTERSITTVNGGRGTPAVRDMQAFAASLMDETPVAPADILLPTLLLMQPGSGLVTNEKARAGAWHDSLTEKRVADRGETVEIVPFGFHKTWVVFKRTPAKPEFVRVEPYTVRPTRERSEMIDGVEYQNFETINYYVLRTSDILEPTALPFLLRFRSTGYIVGKKMETMRAQLHKAQRPHCFSTFKLGSSYKENDKGKFYIPTLEWGRETTSDELTAVKPWSDLAKAGRVKADDADLVRDSDGGPHGEEGGGGQFHA